MNADQPQKGLKRILIQSLKPVWLPFRGESSGGFTLLELVTVVAIVGILSSIGIPQYASQIDKARNTKAIADLRVIEKEILIYNASNGVFPDALADIGRDTLMDPWGNPYQYLNLTTNGNNGQRRKDRNMNPINNDFDLYSMGKDGRSQSQLNGAQSHDDIVRALDGRFLDLANKFE